MLPNNAFQAKSGLQQLNFKFVANNYSSHLECPLCQKLMIRPRRLHRCGHTFCQVCLTNFNEVLSSGNSMGSSQKSKGKKALKASKSPKTTQIKKCPLEHCNKPVEAIQEDRTAQNLINELRVKCSNEGCVWKGTYEQYKRKHMDSCPLKGGFSKWLQEMREEASNINKRAALFNPSKEEEESQQDRNQSLQAISKRQVQGQKGISHVNNILQSELYGLRQTQSRQQQQNHQKRYNYGSILDDTKRQKGPEYFDRLYKPIKNASVIKAEPISERQKPTNKSRQPLQEAINIKSHIETQTFVHENKNLPNRRPRSELSEGSDNGSVENGRSLSKRSNSSIRRSKSSLSSDNPDKAFQKRDDRRDIFAQGLNKRQQDQGLEYRQNIQTIEGFGDSYRTNQPLGINSGHQPIYNPASLLRRQNQSLSGRTQLNYRQKYLQKQLRKLN